MMRPLTFLTTLATAFAGQRGAPPAPPASEPGFPTKHADAPSVGGKVLFPALRNHRARRNPTPNDGRGHYLTEQHPSPAPLRTRLSVVARKLDDVSKDTALSGKRLRRRVRELSCAAGHLIARSEHAGIVAARRAA